MAKEIVAENIWSRVDENFPYWFREVYPDFATMGPEYSWTTDKEQQAREDRFAKAKKKIAAINRWDR